ncbi:MAG: ADP-glyceromanno-heptose 6-epimerase [Gammaproteobacteria bacterium]|nr:MAG: ADP-glyceromanno-heptose 6-epimerase [Gammaproteobacteria bacterium]
MIIVTGAAGFIGSNLVKALNEQGETNIRIVEDFEDGRKMFNLADCRIRDYADRDETLRRMRAGEDVIGTARAVLHQGACSTTTEWNGRYMMETNFEFSQRLLGQCLAKGTPFIYASSASVYGAGQEFRVHPDCEHPINMYAFSKLAFDNYVRQYLPDPPSQVVGLRYFNVYGPREQHKGSMASVVWHFHQQLLQGDELRLFEGSDGYADGEQRRDFVYVDDIVKLNLWFLERPGISGIFNAGTGRSQTFNEVARAVIAWHGHGKIRYVPFPDELRGSYQSFTEADLTELRAAGYSAAFVDVEEGVRRYLDAL